MIEEEKEFARPSAARSFSLVLPCLNEKDSLPETLDRCNALYMALESWNLEVIIVDDGSTDGTSELLKEALDGRPWLRLITHSTNLGYGAALRTGFQAAGGMIVGYTDADNQFDITEFSNALPLIESVDLVAGFRVYRFDPLARLVVSWVYNRLVRILFRVPVRDVDCSFKLMRRDKLDRLVLMCDDFFIDTEIVARARKWNWRIVEVGVRHYPRKAGKTTVRPSDVSRTLRRIGQMWFAIHYPKRSQHAELAEKQERARRIARGS
ncbi:MAG: glycosyltransferase family 2 protein [Acidimicrobiia bacterium]